jgi:uncharacterized phage protein gp47/JayE
MSTLPGTTIAPIGASYNYVIDTGTIVPDSSTILQEVQQEFTTALGPNLNTNAATPQGTLIAAETLARTNVIKNNADLANVFNPNLSYGVYLDGVCALLGITRGSNTYTTATNVMLSGGSSPVTVTAGSQMATPTGNLFQVLYAVTIPANGTAMATIQSLAYGPVALPIGPLTIVNGIIGWGGASVTSSTVVTPGTLALQDPQLKSARNQRLFTQGVGSSGSVYAAIMGVPGVTSCMVVENNTGQFAMPVNGVTFTLPSAICVCVSGTPNYNALAQAMYNAHNGGCPWDYGASGMGMPYGSPNGVAATDPYTNLPYNVKFTTPIMYDTYVNITVSQQSSVASPTEAIQNAILAYAEGELTGEPGFGTGDSVSAFEVAGSVIQQLPGMYVSACMIACVPAGSPPPIYPTDYVYEYAIGPFEEAQLQVGNIQVNLAT